ncbi:MAG: hypothetical protein WC438_02730 [Candidatus Pacearchaeota archaeon]
MLTKIEKEIQEQIIKSMQIWKKQRLEKILVGLRQKGILISEENIPEIIKQTNFDFRSKEYPYECSYYTKDSPPSPCIKGATNHNCLLCACPNYDSSYTDEGLTGKCNVNSNSGHYHKSKEFPNISVWDCSACNHPHLLLTTHIYLSNNLKLLRKLQDKL